MKIASLVISAALALAPAVTVAKDAMKPMPGVASPDTTNSPAGKAETAAMQEMMKTMNGMQPTGDPDTDFVMMMIPHHQGAIDMAEVELKYGKDKQLRALADMIVVAQRKEITTMKKWQSDHGQ